VEAALAAKDGDVQQAADWLLADGTTAVAERTSDSAPVASDNANMQTAQTSEPQQKTRHGTKRAATQSIAQMLVKSSDSKARGLLRTLAEGPDLEDLDMWTEGMCSLPTTIQCLANNERAHARATEGKEEQALADERLDNLCSILQIERRNRSDMDKELMQQIHSVIADMATAAKNGSSFLPPKRECTPGEFIAVYRQKLKQIKAQNMIKELEVRRVADMQEAETHEQQTEVATEHEKRVDNERGIISWASAQMDAIYKRANLGEKNTSMLNTLCAPTTAPDEHAATITVAQTTLDEELRTLRDDQPPPHGTEYVLWKERYLPRLEVAVRMLARLDDSAALLTHSGLARELGLESDDVDGMNRWLDVELHAVKWHDNHLGALIGPELVELNAAAGASPGDDVTPRTMIAWMAIQQRANTMEQSLRDAAARLLDGEPRGEHGYTGLNLPDDGRHAGAKLAVMECLRFGDTKPHRYTLSPDMWDEDDKKEADEAATVMANTRNRQGSQQSRPEQPADAETPMKTDDGQQLTGHTPSSPELRASPPAATPDLIETEQPATADERSAATDEQPAAPMPTTPADTTALMTTEVEARRAQAKNEAAAQERSTILVPETPASQSSPSDGTVSSGEAVTQPPDAQHRRYSTELECRVAQRQVDSSTQFEFDIEHAKAMRADAGSILDEIYDGTDVKHVTGCAGTADLKVAACLRELHVVTTKIMDLNRQPWWNDQLCEMHLRAYLSEVYCEASRDQRLDALAAEAIQHYCKDKLAHLTIPEWSMLSGPIYVIVTTGGWTEAEWQAGKLPAAWQLHGTQGLTSDLVTKVARCVGLGSIPAVLDFETFHADSMENGFRANTCNTKGEWRALGYIQYLAHHAAGASRKRNARKHEDTVRSLFDSPTGQEPDPKRYNTRSQRATLRPDAAASALAQGRPPPSV